MKIKKKVAVGSSPRARIWFVSHGFMLSQYPFGDTTKRQVDLSPKITIAAAVAFMKQEQRELLRDPKDTLVWDYVRDLRSAGFDLQPVSLADIVEDGRGWAGDIYFVLPKVRNPAFPSIVRDYRIWLIADSDRC